MAKLLSEVKLRTYRTVTVTQWKNDFVLFKTIATSGLARQIPFLLLEKSNYTAPR